MYYVQYCVLRCNDFPVQKLVIWYLLFSVTEFMVIDIMLDVVNWFPVQNMQNSINIPNTRPSIFIILTTLLFYLFDMPLTFAVNQKVSDEVTYTHTNLDYIT